MNCNTPENKNKKLNLNSKITLMREAKSSGTQTIIQLTCVFVCIKLEFRDRQLKRRNTKNVKRHSHGCQFSGF